MSDVDAFFDEVSQLGGAAAPEPEQAAEVQPAPEIPAEAPAEAPTEPEPQPETPATPEPPKQEQTVPLAVYLRERDERRRDNEEREQIKRRNAELEAAQRQPAQPRTIPDPVDDPNGFAAAIRAENEAQLVQQRFQISREIANQTHGTETVEAARQWAMDRAASDPSFDLALGQQPHPIDWIVRQHKRDGLLAQIGDDVDGFVRRRYAELNPVLPTPAVAPAALVQPAPAPQNPPRSLAAAPSSGGGVKDIPVGPMTALESVFTK